MIWSWICSKRKRERLRESTERKSKQFMRLNKKSSFAWEAAIVCRCKRKETKGLNDATNPTCFPSVFGRDLLKPYVDGKILLLLTATAAKLQKPFLNLPWKHFACLDSWRRQDVFCLVRLNDAGEIVLILRWVRSLFVCVFISFYSGRYHQNN